MYDVSQVGVWWAAWFVLVWGLVLMVRLVYFILGRSLDSL